MPGWRGAVVLMALISARAAAQDPVPVNQRGPASAPVTIEEYCVYDLEACSRLHVIVSGVLATLPEGETHLVFRHVAADSASVRSMRYRAALAAGAQGGFWALHDTMLANRERSSLNDVLAMAAQLGLDAHRIAAEMDSADIVAAAERDRHEAAAHAITTVPAVIVNGRLVAVTDARSLRAAIAASRP